jgi:NTE family protein
MPPTAHKKTHHTDQRPPFECIALLLQGGGALGAYQGGCYEALAEAGIHPDWVAGISIGAINSALIAGNPPEHRVEKLRQFWERVTTDAFEGWAQDLLTPLLRGDWSRRVVSRMSAGLAMVDGAAGFFTPRSPWPWFHPTGSIEATSFYDTARLRSTLESLWISTGSTRRPCGSASARSMCGPATSSISTPRPTRSGRSM